MTFSKEEILKIKCERANEDIGDENEYDGIECEICKNKGFIFYIENNSIFAKDCKCKSKRNLMRSFYEKGITQEMLNRFTFANFDCYNETAKKVRGKFLSLCEDVKNGERHWLMICGNSGSGKTMLCTATFQRLMKSDFDCEYFLWNKEAPKLINLETSKMPENMQKYDVWLKRLEEVEVLYIDDFLKLTTNTRYNKHNLESLSLAFKILDGRYRRGNNITIISTEFSPQEIEQMNEAILSRIYERAKGGKYLFTTSLENYRYKKEE